MRLEDITREIEAYDPDTTADLKFTIDWAESYAAKPGFVVEREFFEGYVRVCWLRTLTLKKSDCRELANNFNSKIFSLFFKDVSS